MAVFPTLGYIRYKERSSNLDLTPDLIVQWKLGLNVKQDASSKHECFSWIRPDSHFPREKTIRWLLILFPCRRACDKKVDEG